MAPWTSLSVGAAHDPRPILIMNPLTLPTLLAGAAYLVPGAILIALHIGRMVVLSVAEHFLPEPKL